MQYTIATEYDLMKYEIFYFILLLKISGMMKLNGRPDEISAK